ncbi:MAG: hypothetical protein IKB77_03880 [Lentisphaeria bacterium]|nr:hypothetical protein [Lentisphaeria bacterium]
MLGLGDFWVLLAYSANIIVVVVCIIYGVINWNRGGENSLTENKENK